MAPHAQPSTTRGIDLARLPAGFADPVHDAQQAFRLALDALAHPGRLLALPASISAHLAPPAGLPPAQAALLLALADRDTALWLPADTRHGLAGDYLRFHCGTPLVADPGQADFVVLPSLAALPGLDTLRLGEAAYPDRSATLIVEVNELADSGPIRLRGPGIAGSGSIAVGGWTQDVTAFLQHNRARFPLGVDLLLTHGRQVLGLPRTTIVEV